MVKNVCVVFFENLLAIIVPKNQIMEKRPLFYGILRVLLGKFAELQRKAPLKKPHYYIQEL